LQNYKNSQTLKINGLGNIKKLEQMEEGIKRLWADDIIEGWDIVVSKDLQQVTDNGSVLVANDLLVVETIEDVVDLVAVDIVVHINSVDIKVVPGWVGDIVITVDCVHIKGRGNNAADDFLDVVKRQSPEDGIELRGDVLGDEELLEEGFLHNNVGLNFVGANFAVWDNLLVNLNVNDPWLLNDNLGFSSYRLDNVFLVSGGDLNFSANLSGLSNNWLVDEQSTVDFVQKIFVVVVVQGVDSSIWELTSSEGDLTSLVWELTWEGLVLAVRIGGVWVDGVTFLNSVSEDLGQIITNCDFTSVSVHWVILVVVVVSIIIVVAVWVDSSGGGLSNDLDLWNNVLVEKDWVPEVALELRDGPELLEQGAFYVTSEDGWVLRIERPESWNAKIFSEERA